MQLKKTVSSLTQSSDYPGILKAKLEHKIESSTGNVEYLGPPIDKEQWLQVLSFFRWVNSTMHSEAQVRFYVNAAEKKTMFWAFPQKARTGMTAQEIDCKEHDAKLGEIQGQGFVAFGTNHSHCSAGAFQSGTDEHDEKNQHGLHITMGKVDQDTMDIHARFYLNGYCFDPDLSAFWDIGENVKAIVPKDLWDRVARHQMCKFESRPFPDEWKSNVIEIKTAPYTPAIGYGAGFGSTGYGSTADRRVDWSKTGTWRTLIERAEDFVDDACKELPELTENPDDLLDYLNEMDTEPMKTILALLERHKLHGEIEIIEREINYRIQTNSIGLSEGALTEEKKEDNGKESKDNLGSIPSQELSDLEKGAWGMME